MIASIAHIARKALAVQCHDWCNRVGVIGVIGVMGVMGVMGGMGGMGVTGKVGEEQVYKK
jgi:hypothetical protein